jgi:putative ABC transport system ATP-binding protein
MDVLKDITFSIDKGEFLSIMGSSGCGKSTLLYLLGGLDNPTSGNIIINGRDYSKIKENEKSKMRRRELGFVFQFYNLVPNLNVEDNILLPILLDGKKPKAYEDELKRILEVIGMTDRRRHTPRELSGGQQQRVAIARALLFNPEIILADEPIGNLDSKSGIEIMKLFRNINSELGKTIIQVTHSLEAADYGTRILNLKDGEIERDEMSA